MLLVAFAGNAVAEFRRHRPDITLMDLRLPGANGTDILIGIRGEFPHARIIMLTTSDSDGDLPTPTELSSTSIPRLWKLCSRPHLLRIQTRRRRC